MIKDYLINYEKYSELPDGLKQGLKYLSSADWNSIKDGKYILSDSMYVNIQSYITKPDADFEAHREYADIQFIIDGCEYISVTDYNSCTPKIPYSEDKDIEFLSGDGENIRLNKGEFMILNPSDAHKPSISIDVNNPVSVRKAVVKVKI